MQFGFRPETATVIYTHGKTADLAANKLFTAMERIIEWLDQSASAFFPKDI